MFFTGSQLPAFAKVELDFIVKSVTRCPGIKAQRGSFRRLKETAQSFGEVKNEEDEKEASGRTAEDTGLVPKSNLKQALSLTMSSMVDGSLGFVPVSTVAQKVLY